MTITVPPSRAQRDADAALGTTDFIRRHGLWTPEQEAAAEAVLERVTAEDLRTVRIATADPHGKLRGKTVLAPLVGSLLRNGIDFATALYYFDTADGIVYNPFVAGGGLGDHKLNGFPDVVLVPDPLTFTTLPWAPRTGFCLGSVYFNDGTPVPFDGRHQLKRQLDLLEQRYGLGYLVGLEVEFYLTRLVDAPLALDALGGPGQPMAPPQVTPLAGGYAYQSDDHQDQIEGVLAALADNLMGVGLPLRTMEDEWGPGQCEFTFSPLPGLAAADAMLLFRAATKQVARRMGLHATFMCRPGLPSFYGSGWHLHQSLVDANGDNVFATPAESDEILSTTGRAFVAGILEQAGPASVFTTPTLNGYRRRTPFSLAPDRATWGIDNRAAMLRVQGAPGDSSTHVENRIGEPAANPYLFMASQLIAGMDGLARGLDPGEPEIAPYAAEHCPLLPKTLMEAVELTRTSPLYREAFGDGFVDWLLGLKDFEIKRFLEAEKEWDPENVSEWEHREYFAQY
ncbi:MAG: glutamine synthetase [Pseudonocardiales bacterium]|nr:glutamine synthetase [Pseudonocardiales bacterium]